MSKLNKKNKVLVFGAGGSLGGRLVQLFSVEPKLTLIALSTTMNPGIVDGVNYVRIKKREESFEKVFSDYQPDYCVNASGSPSVGFSFQNEIEDRYLNTTIPELILTALASSAPSCRFINFSSAAVYGNPESLPITESSPLKPISPYGTHKLLAEEAVKTYSDKGVQAASFRIFSAFGPGLKKQLLWDLAQKCKQQDTISLMGDGTESRDFIYIEDIAKICLSYFDSGHFDGRAINVCSGVEKTIRACAEQYVSLCDKDIAVQFDGKVRTGDPRNWRGSNSKLQSIIDFELTPFETGIKAYHRWLLEQGAI